VQPVALWGTTRFDALSGGVAGRARLAVRMVVAMATVAWRVATARRPDVIVVLFPGQLDMLAAGPVARLRRIPVVFEYFISMHETMVTDRRLVAPGGALAGVLARVDRVSARLATVVVADTDADADFIAATTGVDPASVAVVPIGPDPAVYAPAGNDAEPVPGRVLFYGTFIPLHGIDTIVAAASDPRCAGLEFRLVGRGQLRPDIERLVAGTGAPVTLAEPVTPQVLATEIAAAEVCLGVFGTGDKTARVVPNKVLECLAVGRPVITADTPAVRDALGDAVVRVPAGDPGALAAAVRSLVDDPQRRAGLVAAGWALMDGPYSDGSLAGTAASVVASVLSP
jgi:glycosyltransferase involved in cell wall biosynthesis